MPGTRSSARLAATSGSSPVKSQDDKTPTKGGAGSKRKADTTGSPKTKRGKKTTPQKGQKTIEETLPGAGEEDTPKDIEMKEAADEGEGTGKKAGELEAPDSNNKDEKTGGEGEGQESKDAEVSAESTNGAARTTDANRKDEENPDTTAATNGGEKAEATDTAETADQNATSNGAVQESAEREEIMPSSILEKGFIYFFTRGRVGIDEPESVQDLQRTYIVMRPIAKSAKIGEGAVADQKNLRLLALPKKVLPKSPRDRFMVFVEKANASVEDLKNDVFGASDYDTKTTGTRHTPAATPVGEGVYALTSAGRASHLVYMLTIPHELGEVQEEMGLRQKGSFITSLKNPTRKGPANASLPQGPDFPQDVLNDFEGRAWTSVRPKHLEYENAQFLLIGEDSEKGLEPSEKDKKHHKETPLEEMEKLEHEDEIRVQHLHGDDSVFDDLGLDHKEYPKVLTTW